MIVWITETFNRRRTSYEPKGVYYDVLDLGASNEEAMEAEGWSELAAVGEVYEGDGFTITVEEE